MTRILGMLNKNDQQTSLDFRKYRAQQTLAECINKIQNRPERTFTTLVELKQILNAASIKVKQVS